MTLFRGISRRTNAPEQDPTAPDEPAPPPQNERGPVTAPRLWAPMGALNAEFDPCGAPPISSDNGGKQ